MVFRFNGKIGTIAGLLCLIVLLGVLSACSSGSTGSAPSGATGTGAGPVQEVKVDAGDYFFDPGDITIKAGKVKFLVTNVGKVAHRFGITGAGVNVTTRNVLAGKQGVLEVELAPGTYKTFCSLGDGDHEKQGAVGKLTVQ